MFPAWMWAIYVIGVLIGFIISGLGSNPNTTDKQIRRYFSMAIIWPLFLLVVVSRETYDFLVNNPVREDEDE